MVAKTQNGTPKRGHLAPETVDRKIRALELRRAGKTFDEIAAALGYADRGGAYKAVETGLRETLRETATDLRTLELQRLDELTAAFWPMALSGDAHAADRVLAMMKRRADLLGLDAPTKIQDVTPKGYATGNTPEELFRPNP